jgi:hypothetical protein
MEEYDGTCLEIQFDGKSWRGSLSSIAGNLFPYYNFVFKFFPTNQQTGLIHSWLSNNRWSIIGCILLFGFLVYRYYYLMKRQQRVDLVDLAINSFFNYQLFFNMCFQMNYKSALLIILSLIVVIHCNNELFHKYFSKDHSIVDDAQCSVSDVTISNERLSKVLDQLVKKTFFKIFKVDLKSPCPFWVMKQMCGLSGGCNVCVCDESEVR